jgi:hypothetical protein
LKVIDEAIVDLAWTHSYLTWWQVGRRLKKPLELPEEYTAMLERADGAVMNATSTTPQGAA